MENEENDCHSHIFEPLFSNHSKTLILKRKVDIHVFLAVEKYFFIPRRSRRDIVLASSVCPSVRPFCPSVRPEPYLSTYWSDLIHSWYK